MKKIIVLFIALLLISCSKHETQIAPIEKIRYLCTSKQTKIDPLFPENIGVYLEENGIESEYMFYKECQTKGTVHIYDNEKCPSDTQKLALFDKLSLYHASIALNYSDLKLIKTVYNATSVSDTKDNAKNIKRVDYVCIKSD